ncbi:HutD family protein [Fusibacter ferrireducens]|uniref:HutD family protein n=1 Tax=Fusibacter ferrireducens TaxID=2785058 RepID=A0ABR9ZXZ1_9FIRM|nr:HutD family protein [Fusibacter ferrireducens]MBF4695336.1 HutD family protein [Fusibacter ferrireducens]
MKYHVVSRAHQKQTNWSGGETIEIFIYPENGNYSERQFSWRVSSATVEKAESDFTPLYGIKRWILPFDAPLLLKHRNQQKLLYEILVKPYEAHCFKGDWETKSIGITRDFNLMLREGSYGILKHFKLAKATEMDIEAIFPEIFDNRLVLIDKRFTIGIYCIEGTYSALMAEQDIPVQASELLLVDNDSKMIQEYKTLSVNQLDADYLNLVIFFVAYDAQ